MVGAVDCVETKPEGHKVLMNHCRRHVVTKLRMRTKCGKIYFVLIFLHIVIKRV